jgi:hypothetical protein
MLINTIQEQQRLVNLRREEAKKRNAVEKQVVASEQTEVTLEQAHRQAERLLIHISVVDQSGKIDGNQTHSVRTQLSALCVYTPQGVVKWQETYKAFQKFLTDRHINYTVR